MNETLEAARIAWMEAEQRAEQWANDDREKSAKWRAAIAHRESIPERIVLGEVLHKADLTQAKVLEADAKNNATMAEALARAGRKRADEAELNYLSEKAKDFRLRHEAAKSLVLQRSIWLDRAISKANDAADDLANAEREMADIVAQSHQLNLEIEARTNGGERVNQVLQALEQAEKPKVRLHHLASAVPPPRLRAELVRAERGHRLAVSGVFDVVVPSTAEQHIRNAYGIPLPPPPPPPSSALEPQPQADDVEPVLDVVAIAAE